MKDSSVTYIKELIEYLNKNTRFKTGFNDIVKNIDKITDLSQYSGKDIKENLLNNYKGLFSSYYNNFQTNNINYDYKGNYTEEQIINKKANNVFTFNAVMNNIFKNVILEELNEKIPDNKLSFELYEYTFGGLDDKEIEMFDESIETNKATRSIVNFYLKHGIKTKADETFDKYKEIMSSITSELEDATTSKDVNRLVQEFATDYALMREHFRDRGFFSKYFTPSGLLECYMLEHAKNTLIEAIPEDFIDEIKFSVKKDGKEEIKDIFDISNEELKDCLEYKGKSSQRDLYADAASIKVTDALRNSRNEQDIKVNKEEYIINDIYREGMNKDTAILDEKDYQADELEFYKDLLKIETKEVTRVALIDDELKIIDNPDINPKAELNVLMSKIPDLEGTIHNQVTNIIEANKIHLEGTKEIHKEIKAAIGDKKLTKEEKRDLDAKKAGMEVDLFAKEEDIKNRVQCEIDLDFYSPETEITDGNNLFDDLEQIDVKDFNLSK